MMRVTCSFLLLISLLPAEPQPGEPTSGKSGEEREEQHTAAADGLASGQDELAADVQQLAIEQTVPKVIELFHEVEALMDESTDRLDASDTGGGTIAAQTEVIEKIYAAAKERQSQGGSGSAGSAMMEMMERMMGKDGKDGKGGQSGKGGAGDQAGQGNQGSGDGTADAVTGAGDQGGESERRVPKAAGRAGRVIPAELRKAFDAYNRGAESKLQAPGSSPP